MMNMMIDARGIVKILRVIKSCENLPQLVSCRLWMDKLKHRVPIGYRSRIEAEYSCRRDTIRGWSLKFS